MSEYQVKDGRIVSPGKFEGEPEFVPGLWSLGLEGCADVDSGKEYFFDYFCKREADADHPGIWPFLGSKAGTVTLSEDDQGFVRAYAVTL